MKRTQLQRKTPLRKIGRKGRRIKKEMDALTPALFERSGGLCEHCGHKPDWRGLHRHHKDHDRSNNTMENIEVWCARCHFGPDGHPHNEVESEPMWSI